MKLRYTLLLMLTLLASLPMVAQQKSKKVQQLEQQRKEVIKAIEKTDRELSRVKNDKNKKQQEATLLKKKVAQRQELVVALDNEIKELSSDIDSLARQEYSPYRRGRAAPTGCSLFCRHLPSTKPSGA